MIDPPRTAEVVLESLCAQASYGDALLGDLTEAFSLRVARDGERVARLWYYREAMRSTAHLLFAWMRGLRVSDAKRLVGVILASYVFTLMLALFVITAMLSSAHALGISGIATFEQGPTRFFPIWAWVPFGIAYTTLAGYIAAWLNEQEPLPTALALGIVWACAGVAERLLTGGNNVPGWLTGFTLTVTVAGPVTGGILRIRQGALRSARA
jgi:hypothetical protein